VRRGRRATLGEALDLIEHETRAAAAVANATTIDLRVRRYAPEEQVAARAELKGPQRFRPDVHAGFDAGGGGPGVGRSGGGKRVALDGDGNPYAALRRALQSTSVEP